jgi:hypothetical protein
VIGCRSDPLLDLYRQLASPGGRRRHEENLAKLRVAADDRQCNAVVCRLLMAVSQRRLIPRRLPRLWNDAKPPATASRIILRTGAPAPRSDGRGAAACRRVQPSSAATDRGRRDRTDVAAA